MSGDPRAARWRHLGVGWLGLVAACAGCAAAFDMGPLAALAAVPVVPGRVAERPPVPAGVP